MIFGRTTRTASPGNIYAEILIFRRIAKSWTRPLATASWIRPRPMRSPGAGGYDVVAPEETIPPSAVPWTAQALPSVIALTALPDDLAAGFRFSSLPTNGVGTADRAERVIDRCGTQFRVHIDMAGADPPAVLLPLDELFELRAAAAVRLWRGLTGRNPRPNPAVLSPARRRRLILGLQALDGHLADASYREIARVLFGADRVAERAWKTHDARDQTIRLVRFGTRMMEAGYRRLLLYPYRRRP